MVYLYWWSSLVGTVSYQAIGVHINTQQNTAHKHKQMITELYIFESLEVSVRLEKGDEKRKWLVKAVTLALNSSAESLWSLEQNTSLAQSRADLTVMYNDRQKTQRFTDFLLGTEKAVNHRHIANKTDLSSAESLERPVSDELRLMRMHINACSNKRCERRTNSFAFNCKQG